MSTEQEWVPCWCGKPAAWTEFTEGGPPILLCMDHKPQYEIKIVRGPVYGPQETEMSVSDLPIPWHGPAGSEDALMCEQIVQQALWLSDEKRPVQFHLGLAKLLQIATSLRIHRS